MGIIIQCFNIEASNKIHLSCKLLSGHKSNRNINKKERYSNESGCDFKYYQENYLLNVCNIKNKL